MTAPLAAPDPARLQAIAAIPPEAMAGLSAEQLCPLKPERIARLSAAQIRQLLPHTIAALSVKQAEALTPEAVNALAPDALRLLNPRCKRIVKQHLTEKTLKLPGMARALNLSASIEFALNIDPQDAAEMSPEDLKALQPDALASLSPEAFVGLRSKAIMGISSKAVARAARGAACENPCEGTCAALRSGTKPPKSHLDPALFPARRCCCPRPASCR